MNFLGAVILAALFLLAGFTLANWSVLSAPATLSFVAFDVEGPLGVILLDEAANGLAALVAEMDDKIGRALARNATEAEGG